MGSSNPGKELGQAMRELKEQASEIKIYLNGLEMNCLGDLLDESAWTSTKKEGDKYLSSKMLVTRD